MVLTLKEYTAIGERGLYVSSRREWRRISPKEAANVNRMISLKKYRIPSEDEVVDLIVGKAYELKRNPNKEEKEGSLESELKKLNSIQEGILEDIRNRNAERIIFIRQNTIAPDVKDGERKETMDEKLKKLGLGHRGYLNLLLVKGLIPSRKVMRTLIGCKAPISKYHEINGKDFLIDEVKGIIDTLYDSVPTRDKIREIRDTSEAHLEYLAKEPIQRIIAIEMDKKGHSKGMPGNMQFMPINIPN